MKKFLLHVCCSVCSAGTISQLNNEFNLTCYFYNPNIHPEEEYNARLADTEKYCNKMDIPFFEGPYDKDAWFTAIKGLEDEPEGGARCTKCFYMRLANVAEYASKNKFDIFGTTLTIGRNKKAEIINPIGVLLAKRFGIEFFEADFKKKGGQQQADEISKHEHLYRQNYCGCVFSKQESLSCRP